MSKKTTSLLRQTCVPLSIFDSSSPCLLNIGFPVCYLPTVPNVQDFALHINFSYRQETVMFPSLFRGQRERTYFGPTSQSLPTSPCLPTCLGTRFTEYRRRYSSIREIQPDSVDHPGFDPKCGRFAGTNKVRNDLNS